MASRRRKYAQTCSSLSSENIFGGKPPSAAWVLLSGELYLSNLWTIFPLANQQVSVNDV